MAAKKRPCKKQTQVAERSYVIAAAVRLCRWNRGAASKGLNSRFGGKAGRLQRLCTGAALVVFAGCHGVAGAVRMVAAATNTTL
jgi:hypothetical protein